MSGDHRTRQCTDCLTTLVSASDTGHNALRRGCTPPDLRLASGELLFRAVDACGTFIIACVGMKSTVPAQLIVRRLIQVGSQVEPSVRRDSVPDAA